MYQIVFKISIDAINDKEAKDIAEDISVESSSMLYDIEKKTEVFLQEVLPNELPRIVLYRNKFGGFLGLRQ